MTYDLRPDAITGGASAPAAEPAAGKRARTDALPASAQSTGVPIVDQGTKCDRGEPGECFLTREQRRDILRVIGDRAGIVGANARDALTHSRIEQLLDEPDGWGPLAEFFFYSTTGPIIGTIMKGVKASRFVGAADDIQATLVNVSRAQRKVLQGMVGVAPGKDSKVRFLELCGDAIGPWQKSLTEVEPVDLDDGGLVALKDSLDPDVLTRTFFKDRITDMLARFGKQKIDQVGVTAIYRHGVPVYIGKGKSRRLILMEDKGLHQLTGSGDDTKPRDLVQKLDDGGKPIVVDKDLESATVAFYKSRTGRDVAEMDIEAAIAKGGSIGKLAGGLMIDAVTGIGGWL